MSGLSNRDLRIPKTIKLFINGEFVRTESGRSFAVMQSGTDNVFAHLCQASRKDLRNAVEAANKALPGWSKRSAYNRGQILYRMAEMAESRRDSFTEILVGTMGHHPEQAQDAIEKMIDAFVYFAGFTDKYQQIIGAVNPVSSPHHNFTTAEPTGVVALVSSPTMTLDQFALHICAIVASGNSLVALMVPEMAPLIAPLAEVFATSDLPAGVVNLVTGFADELVPGIGEHMEIHAIDYQGDDAKMLARLKETGAENMKRVYSARFKELSVEPLLQFVEYKTIWHPIGV